MKKRLAVLLMVLALCGCSYGEETQSCDWCNKRVSASTLVYTENDDYVCANCIQKKDYSKCISCGKIYELGWDCYDGYCISCSETETWFCVVCEEYESVEDLVQVADGYYMCASCVFYAAKPFDNAFQQVYADYISPFDENNFEFMQRHTVLGIESTYKGETDSSVFDPDEQSYYFKDHDAWYDEGYDKGYDNGYDNGYEDGYDEGYDEGNTVGQAAGKSMGYSDGYAAGKAYYQSSFSSASSPQTKVQEITVYITNTGEKYHRSWCQYLHSSKIATTRSSAISRGYTACSVCW